MLLLISCKVIEKFGLVAKTNLNLETIHVITLNQTTLPGIEDKILCSQGVIVTGNTL